MVSGSKQHKGKKSGVATGIWPCGHLPRSRNLSFLLFLQSKNWPSSIPNKHRVLVLQFLLLFTALGALILFWHWGKTYASLLSTRNLFAPLHGYLLRVRVGKIDLHDTGCILHFHIRWPLPRKRISTHKRRTWHASSAKFYPQFAQFERVSFPRCN